MKTAVQLDFDGTVTVEDVSFLLLDTYVGEAWYPWKDEYSAGRIPVGTFNREVFGMMTADRETMTKFVLTNEHVVVRSGFKEFIEYCQGKGYRLVITSNGLRFYIEAILAQLGISGIEIHAAENEFSPDGMKVRYIGADGTIKEDGFKDSFTEGLIRQGYDIVFAGNGNSDIRPARLAKHVFATEDLLTKCREEGLAHYPFEDFRSVLATLKSLDLG